MKTRLSDIGELGLIKEISRNTRLSPSVIKGIGDDSAVIKHTKDKYLLYTTDMLIEDVHFRKGKASAQAIGHKALAVNISDIAACGGLPRWAVISAGVPSNSSYRFLKDIYKGIKGLADKFNIDIVGGDTNLSKKIIISISLIGEVEKRFLVLRQGAEKKDIIVISGAIKDKPDDLTFEPRLKQARMLVKNIKINSMIDISDGLLSDLNHVLEASRKGAIIYEPLIPHKPVSTPLIKALNRGEQFELLFTVPRREVKKLPQGFYPIGEITDKKSGIIYVNKRGKREKIEPAGYRHF
ncbi:MAG: thiamine-monophosphate kinase [Candidatus Omnitrophica bacterium]|nr:thiamine-monophosphate kinase [Candidatus Omnitrophota bacterium]